ncbi:MAG: ribosome small subunit-dependent GTPase A [Bacilli bacterium]|nr:ribosome small subunit-dependent GTPase A [Bacilli bacterium]
MEGKIVKIISNDYTVLSNNKYYICKARGKFRNIGVTPLVGDNVIFSETDNYILEVKDRINSLIRPYVSNIDQVFVITSTKHPDIDLNLLDKLLVMIEYNNIKPIICLTKLDLLDKEELSNIENVKKYYEDIGYIVLYNTELEKIKKTFKNKVTVFAGQSGVGKSTLLNKLDTNLNLETNEISEALGRGKHTTRHVELIPMFDGLIADTPGFSSLDLTDMTKEDIRDNFIEFNKYREYCKYDDCMHNKEDINECMIKQEIGKNIRESRYANYLKFIEKK